MKSDLKPKGRKVLISGASGFIGSHLTRRLVHTGADVYTLIKPTSSTERFQDVLDQLTIHRADLTDFQVVRAAFSEIKPEYIFHCAGSTDVRRLSASLDEIDKSVSVNLQGTLNILKAVYLERIHVKSFVRTGGLEEYGSGNIPYREEQRERSVSPYSASQVATTHYCQMLQGYFKFPIVTLRLALVYGPAQSSDFLIPSLIEHCIRGQNFNLMSTQKTRDWIYIDDVIDAFMMCFNSEHLLADIINIGSGKEYEVDEVAKLVIRLVNEAPIKLTNREIVENRPSDASRLVCDITKAREVLGWFPKINLEEGLKQTIAWYKKQAMRKTHVRSVKN